MKNWLFILLLIWSALPMTVLYVSTDGYPAGQAIMLMGIGLLLIWVFGIGSIQHHYRDKFAARYFTNLRYPRLTFVGFATLFALAEELIAVLLTNNAPLFGAAMGTAYITASANYIDVVTHHSVIVFLPMFGVLSWLVTTYNFSVRSIFLAFGIIGIFAEVIFGGPMQFINGGFWILVYGLMVYLPAYGIVAMNGTNRKPVRTYHYLALIALPLIAAAIWAVIINGVLFPGHPAIHFPPIQ